MVGRKKEKAKLTKVAIKLPFALGEAEWTPDARERDAAWELYVELVTRVAVQDLPVGQGLLREALTSLYSLFATTREILREAGPEVGAKLPSIGGLAIGVLNRGLRPFLAKWHPLLMAWESRRRPEISAGDHEAAWERADELRGQLQELRRQLSRYAQALGQAAGVDELDPH